MALVLSRKEGQKIIIGDNIVLTVVAINKSGKCRIGVEAPKDVAVDRAEVHKWKQAARTLAGPKG